MSELAAHGTVYNHPNKGHDRLFIDKGTKFFGVFDGAGGDELSEAIVEHLPKIIDEFGSLREASQPRFMAHVLSTLDSLEEGYSRKSTTAVACTQEQGDETGITFANTGDSSIYFLNKLEGTFQLLAHTPTEYIEVDGRSYISTSEFLGARRTPTQLESLIGHLALPKSAEWSLVGITDGVQDDDGQGISLPDLEEVIRYGNPAQVPEEILAHVEPYDDASVFIVAHSL